MLTKMNPPNNPTTHGMVGMSATQDIPTWMFLEVKKNKDANWYGTSAIIREPSGFSRIITKSYDARNKKHA